MLDTYHHQAARTVCLFLLGIVGMLLAPSGALAISAPIHIAGTAGEGVFIRSGPGTSYTAVGWMPEGASPDYNCFVWGQDINGTPIWFNVNYAGKTGYYASFYDDSSYQSNEELTAKYGVPLCGSTPPAPVPAPAPAPTAPAAPPPTNTTPAGQSSSFGSSAPSPAAVYFNPYSRTDSSGPHLVGDGLTIDLPSGGSTTPTTNWYGGHCNQSRRSYEVATAQAGGRPIGTIAGWSLGRLGILSFLTNATVSQLKQLNYVLLVDPGQYWEKPDHPHEIEMECDMKFGGGPYVRWLHENPSAHLVIIAGSLTQSENSKGIQEIYFNDVREGSHPEVSSRILVCNYPIDHQTAFWSSKYWIQHQIGSTRNACPQLSLNGKKWDATAGWHPIN